VKQCYANDGSTIFSIYKQYITSYLNDKVFEFNLSLPHLVSGSKLLQKIAWQSKIEKIKDIDSNVNDFIDYIWQEAIGDLESLFEVIILTIIAMNFIKYCQ